MAGERWLVASEAHLGIESQLARHGAFLRSRSLALADALIADADTAGATRLVLLGDVKHKYTHIGPQESRDVPRFFEKLSSRFEEILVTPGNHDVGLRSLAPRSRFPRVRIARASGTLLGDAAFRVALMHGHATPAPSLVRAHAWLVGHTHVACSLVDEEGRATIEPAWLRGRLDADRVHSKYGKRRAPEIIVFPAYNPLCGGTPVNRDGLLGPVARLVDADAATLWLLDGRRAMDLAGIDLVSKRKPGPGMD